MSERDIKYQERYDEFSSSYILMNTLEEETINELEKKALIEYKRIYKLAETESSNSYIIQLNRLEEEKPLKDIVERKTKKEMDRIMYEYRQRQIKETEELLARARKRREEADENIKKKREAIEKAKAEAEKETPSNSFCRKCSNEIDSTTRKCKKYPLVFCMLLCVILYLLFLTIAFTETNKRDTYICYTTKTGTHFHAANCNYLNTAYETTVYEASKKYKPCNYCNPFSSNYKTTITITERDYLAPALISIPISAVVYILIANKKDNTKRDDV